MNDPQNLGLGELGQRVQAMSDPAPDSRLRPYHGAPPPAPASNGHTSPSLESYEDLRNAPPPSAYQPSPAAYGHQPYQASGPASTANSSGHDPLSSWETVPLRSYAASPSTPPPQQQASLPPPAPSPAASDAPKSGLHRALDAIRSTLPLVQKLLPLIDGNFATAVGALMAPHPHPTPPPPPPVVHIDMEPMERGLAEVRSSHRELRTQVLEQVTTLKRVEDHLERVKEATDRNTLEQQELVEDLRSVGSRLTIFAIVGLILLAASLGLNIFLIFQLQHILR
jgi:hypothetical protein